MTKEIETKMKMYFVELTPELAERLLKHNESNRHLSPSLVSVYAKDILDGNWDEQVGSAISLDERGVLRDGQHRCAAVVKAGKPIKVWICRNVDARGIYDNNRKRTTADQIMIVRPDIDKVFRQTRTVSVMRTLIQHKEFNGQRVAVS